MVGFDSVGKFEGKIRGALKGVHGIGKKRKCLQSHKKFKCHSMVLKFKTILLLSNNKIQYY